MSDIDMPETETRYEHLCQHARQTALLNSIEELLGWDEQTGLPQAAGPYRAEQMTLLTGLVHQRRTDPQLGEWLTELEAGPLATDPHSDSGATIRGLRRDYDRQTKLPQSLVEELTRTAVLGQQAWVTAREQDDFVTFQPLLEKMVELKRQEAEAVGYDGHPYDALLDEYEPDETTANVTTILADLRDSLVPLVGAIRDSGRAAPVEILKRTYPVDAQRTFGTAMATRIGFDFDRGRLDVTHHPFCTGLGPHDHRITTRYDERFFNTAFFGILHEAGHGLYEQGLRTEQHGLPPGEAISLGIHESQSRLWENLVGRSRAFWDGAFADAQAAFPEAIGETTLDDFHFAVNHVEPSLIRVEADEATYNLHILIRFELEQALIAGDLAVADLPGAWNDKYQTYLGVRPPSDADGVLQDIHWSAGLIGYFPTYSLGNLYASQFFETAAADLGGTDELFAQFRRGEFQPLRDWLREKIHVEGRRYSAAQLVERVTGSPLRSDALMRHLRDDLGALYGVG